MSWYQPATVVFNKLEISCSTQPIRETSIGCPKISAVYRTRNASYRRASARLRSPPWRQAHQQGGMVGPVAAPERTSTKRHFCRTLQSSSPILSCFIGLFRDTKMNACSVYIDAKNAYVIASAETTHGFNIATEPMVRVGRRAPRTALGNAVRWALNAYRRGVPVPTDLKKLEKSYWDLLDADRCTPSSMT